ncbi:MAG: SIS domain-containing protein [Parachlamydiales bacterium]|jgi:D-sedoheptulose 7-phosphate isomerase
MDTSYIEQVVEDSIRAVSTLKEPDALVFIQQSARMLSDSLLAGNKVIAIGNGGSLCDATHFAEELTGFFRSKRPALPAIVLNEAGHLTCVANDIGYEFVFSRGVEAYGKPGDVLIALSTSGKSPSIINAVETATKLGLNTISLLGKGGGPLKGKSDLELIIDGFSTSDRIQEAHMAALHIIIELIEYNLFSNNELASAQKILGRTDVLPLS